MSFNKRNKKQVLIAILIVTSACFFSCKKKTSPSTTPSLPATVSFSNDIMPVFNAHCNTSGCHSGGSPAASLNLSQSVAYSQLFAKHEIDTTNASNSNLHIEVASGQMPQTGGKLSDYNISLIQKWIQQKAKNN
ncbi:MAG TPA: hypothetical protein VNX01_06455 [Bacteroidia bacterium]|nr:hypothetical protein [Bacteroidia bacterium]